MCIRHGADLIKDKVFPELDLALGQLIDRQQGRLVSGDMSALPHEESSMQGMEGAQRRHRRMRDTALRDGLSGRIQCANDEQGSKTHRFKGIT